jgi:DNA polymerase I-like protein with 3'-5' exonuclease and polymerase domains
MNYVTTLEQLEASIHELRSQKILGFDTETCPWLTEGTKRQAFTNPYNLTSSGEAAPFDPHTSYIRLMQWQGENTTGYVWDMLKIGPKAKPLVVDFIKSLSKEQTVVGHNIKFDLKMLAGNYDIWLDHYTNIFDTMQCSILLANAVGMRERGHKLKDVSRDFIGVNLDKTDQASDWSKPELTESQLDYAVSDVTYLHQLYDFFKSALEKDYGMSEALQIEMECIGPVARMEYNGVPINLDMYHKIQEAAQYAMPALLGQIGQYFKDKINQPLSLTYVAVKDYETKTENYIPFMLPWGGGKAGKDFLMSRANLVKEMIQELGLTDEDGEPLSTTAKEALIPHKGSHEGISFLLDYWNLVKQSQFEYDKYVHPLTNSVHPRFNPGGASTGRFSCTTPNLNL